MAAAVGALELNGLIMYRKSNVIQDMWWRMKDEMDVPHINFTVHMCDSDQPYKTIQINACTSETELNMDPFGRWSSADRGSSLPEVERSCNFARARPIASSRAQASRQSHRFTHE